MAGEEWGHSGLRSSPAPKALRKDIAQQLSHHDAHAEMVAKRKADRIPGPDIITKADPGAIFYNSWGYDQTNIDWYQVVSRSGVMVTIRPIGCEISSDEGYSPMSGKTIPCKDKFTGPEKRKKLYASGQDLYLPMTHGSCSLWGGKPKYCSWYA